ncbi:MAG: hypothetical protein ABFD25_20500 [Clostridiaceae bacterium]
MKTKVDYSFLHSGSYFQGTMDVMIAACRRFGAEKAAGVISEYQYAIGMGKLEDREIISRIRDYTEVEINKEDIQFLHKLVEARDAVIWAVKALKEAEKIPSGRD